MAKVIDSRDNQGTKFLLENPDVPAELVVHTSAQLPEEQEIIFINNKDPGEVLEFHFHSKTHPLKHYKLIPGQKRKLPVEVIKHLEGQGDKDPYSCHKREYEEKFVDGFSQLFVRNYVSYYQCRPVR